MFRISTICHSPRHSLAGFILFITIQSSITPSLFPLFERRTILCRDSFLSHSLPRENSLKTNPSSGPPFFFASFSFDVKFTSVDSCYKFVFCKILRKRVCTFDNSFIERRKRLFDRFPNVEIRQTRSCRFGNAGSRGNCRALAQTGLPRRASSNPNEIAFMHAVHRGQIRRHCPMHVCIAMNINVYRGRSEIAETFFHRC